MLASNLHLRDIGDVLSTNLIAPTAKFNNIASKMTFVYPGGTSEWCRYIASNMCMAACVWKHLA